MVPLGWPESARTAAARLACRYTTPPFASSRPRFSTAASAPMTVASSAPVTEIENSLPGYRFSVALFPPSRSTRSEEHTSELQSLMRISYAVFCLKKTKKNKKHYHQSQYYKKKQTTKVK